MGIIVTKKNDAVCFGTWVHGKTEDGYAFEAKVFAEPSWFGIASPRYPEGGNVSKLWIVDPEGREILSYDRGFDGDHDEAAEEVMQEIVIGLEALCEAE